MMNGLKSTYTQSNSFETVCIKEEPIYEETEQILPDLPQSSVDVKPSVICKEEVNITDGDNLKKSEPQSHKKINIPFVPEKTLVLINNVLYFIEKIPDPVQQSPIQKTVFENANYGDSSNDPAQCPHCGKMLKHHRNLKLHMQICIRSLNYNCQICPYQTKDEILLMLHNKNCKSHGPRKKLNKSRKEFFSICLKCNIAKISSSSKCQICGSLKRWKCRKCNKQFKSIKKVRYHYETECNPTEYYHCPKCDYRSAIEYRTRVHIKNNHPELQSENLEISIKKRKLAIDASKHVCTKCGKNFETAKGLNRHLFLCKKTQTSSEKVEDYRKLIVPHCKKCDKDIKLEVSQIGFQTNCMDCSLTLEYKCKICQHFHEHYDTILKHVKANCNVQPQIKCEECNYTTICNRLLKVHQKKVHGDISATCTSCGSYFKSSTRFERHIKYCGLSTTLRCHLCLYSTSKEEYLKNHISKIHNKLNSPGVSSVTNKASCGFNRIRPHIQNFCVKCHRRQIMSHRVKYCMICNETLQLRCVTCDKMQSIDDADACKHVKTYLEQIALECKRCGKGFCDESKMKLHEEWCGKTKNYSCKLCKYSSPYISHLRKHEQQAHHIAYSRRKQSRAWNSNQRNESDIEICYVLSESESKNDTGKIHVKNNCNTLSNQKFGSENNNESNAEKYENSNSLANVKSDIENENEPNAINHKNSSDNKLYLQCKVVLTRLKI